MQQNLKFALTRDLGNSHIFSTSVSTNGDAYVQLNHTLQKFLEYKRGSLILKKEGNILLAKGIKELYTKK